MLEVTVWLSADRPDDAEEFLNIDYVSLVSPESYGPPALVAPGKGGTPPTAKVGERVLYINTGVVPMFEIERKADR